MRNADAWMRCGRALLSLATALVLFTSCNGFDGSLDARRYEAMRASWDPIAEDYLDALQDRPPHDVPLDALALQLRADAVQAHTDLIEASKPVENR